jgi:hypothetical protein
VPQIVSLVTTGKSLAVVRASSARQEGRFAIVTKRGAEDAVDAAARKTGEPARTAKSWRPDISTLVSTGDNASRYAGMVARKPDHQGDHEGNR